ncbi:MAG: hypothetical protein LBU79_01375, partial [Planctomycetota bacterium]|nr:hypothetical protein [Planctomycetota bacterium]
MQEVTRDMLGLYEVDRSIMDGKARLMRLQKKVTEQEKVVERARERAREIEGAIRDKAFATDALNLELRNAESEVVDQERRIKEIKNQREYRIISDRIKELKILADDRESAVISGMEELDRLRDAINQGHREIGEEELKLIQFRQETTEET